MPVITLTTDFGNKDPYVGAVKGSIYSQMENATVVDISHCITPFNINEAAYVIQHSYATFPKGTIHIIGIDAERTPENNHIVALLDGHYFICADNGVLSPIIETLKAERIIEITAHERLVTSNYAMDIFTFCACHLARGGNIDLLGNSILKLRELHTSQPSVNDDNDIIYGKVVYIDNYGNAISNISRKLMESVGKKRSFTLSGRSEKYNTIYNRYSDLVDFNSPIENRDVDGKGLAVYNSHDMIVLATYRSNPLTVGSASSLFGLTLGAPILVKFK